MLRLHIRTLRIPIPVRTRMASLSDQISSRRTFAIISHPDAGKTTLTKNCCSIPAASRRRVPLRASRALSMPYPTGWTSKRSAVSPVTSSVLRSSYNGCCVNILDTPGHQDFSEAPRTLMAADAAVMVIDAAKGVEGSDHQAVPRLHPAPHSHLHLCEQARPRGSRSL